MIKFPFKNDWLINDSIFKDAIKTVESKMKIDRSHDIPYVAGYSTDGKTIYIDKDMPKSFVTSKGKRIYTDIFLIWHELVELCLLDKFDTMYQICHQVALRSERDAVENAGIGWDEYNKFMNKYIKKIGDLDDYPNVPKNLDLRPYKDEDDYETLQKMVGGRKNFKQYLKNKDS